MGIARFLFEIYEIPPFPASTGAFQLLLASENQKGTSEASLQPLRTILMQGMCYK